MTRTSCTPRALTGPTSTDRREPIHIELVSHGRGHHAGRIGPGVGRWFHSVDHEGAIIWQGKLLREPRPDVFLVQLFSWLDGRPTDQRLVSIADMSGWIFYRTADEWRAAGDRLFERR